MISNIRKNCMGTISFDAKFAGMRKPQDFIVYPIKGDDDAKQILIQSDTRIGYITLLGDVWMSKPHSGGAYFHHLAEKALIDKLDSETLFTLKAHVLSTAHGDAGRKENGFIGTDNSGALEIFA